MYGILIEGVKYMISSHYGEDVTRAVLANIGIQEFSIYERYSEKIIPDMLTSLGQLTGQSEEEIGILAGRYFVRFMYGYGHGELLRVLGRRFGDFLKGLDNLHAYFRMSYPRIRPPSFSCHNETSDGLTLHYRSRRRGYVSYVMGQMIEVARIFYNQEITVELQNKFEKGGFQYVRIRMSFDNSGFDTDRILRDRSQSLNEFLPVDPVAFLNLFPYLVAFDKNLNIAISGRALLHIMPDMHGRRITDIFNLQRPHIKFRWDTLMSHVHNVIELKSIHPVGRNVCNESKPMINAISVKVPVLTNKNLEGKSLGNLIIDEEPEEEETDNFNYLVLRGALVYLNQSNLLVMLPSTIINNLDEMYNLGLTVSDYSASDCNREMIMVAAQQSVDIKDLLLKEKEKSRALMKTFNQIDESKKRAEALLSTMMPPEVARELLAHGRADKLSICDSFDSVTLAFSKVCDFNEITAHLSPLDVVNLLNSVYSTFDSVIRKHGVYKVETVGECYMMSCGVPYENEFHAEYLADTVLDLIMQMMPLTSTLIPGKMTEIKIGIHSGPVVGAIVGLKAPRYCLFGDTVNCASRLESHNKLPMTIQMSQATKDLLDTKCPQLFVVQARGVVTLKGKGDMNAYTLIMKKGPARYLTHPIRRTSIREMKNSYVMDIDDDDMTESVLSRMSLSQEASRRSGVSLPDATNAEASSLPVTSNWRSSVDIENTIHTVAITKIGSATLQPLAVADISNIPTSSPRTSTSADEKDEKESEKKPNKHGVEHFTINDDVNKSKKEKLMETMKTVIQAAAIPDYSGPDSPKYIVAMSNTSSQKADETDSKTSKKVNVDQKSKRSDRSMDKKVVNKKVEENPQMTVRKKGDGSGDESKAQKMVKRQSSRPIVVTEPPRAVVKQDVSKVSGEKAMQNGPTTPSKTVVVKEPSTIIESHEVRDIAAVRDVSHDITKDANGCGLSYFPNQPCNCESFIEKQRLKTTICSIM